MRDLEEENSRTKLAQLLATLKGRKLPIVQETSSIEEVIAAMIRFEHSRVLFVVNDQGQLTGTISLGTLVRQVFSRRREPHLHPRFLISMITAERAKDIMRTKPMFASEDEEVAAVINRMIESNVKEIPIVDMDKKVVSDLTMIDLLKFLAGRTEG